MKPDRDEMMEETQRFLRQIRRRKIQEPGPGQRVDRCHFSKTGWGIWEGNGCTCIPAKAPKIIETIG